MKLPVEKVIASPNDIEARLRANGVERPAAESREANSLKEIAMREGIDNSCVSRTVNPAATAPDIPDDALPNHVTLFDPAADPPTLWDEQRVRIAGSTSAWGH